ncbi:MAG: MgtC/SapB family protein [Candidatus Paceibacterota bacterium]
MLSIEEMLIRVVVAILLGAVVGFERELVGKEAGIRTDILVSAGAALFTIAGIMVHYVIGLPADGSNFLNEVMGSARGIAIIAGIVTGIGFLGAGLIIKNDDRVMGVTTAASVWFVAAAGMLAGLGLTELAVFSTLGISLLLYLLRKIDLFDIINKEERIEKFNSKDKLD